METQSAGKWVFMIDWFIVWWYVNDLATFQLQELDTNIKI